MDSRKRNKPVQGPKLHPNLLGWGNLAHADWGKTDKRTRDEPVCTAEQVQCNQRTAEWVEHGEDEDHSHNDEDDEDVDSAVDVCDAAGDKSADAVCAGIVS